jgi:hypothetical protein
MEKENVMLASKVDPEVFQKFRAALVIEGKTVGQWIEEKIIEKAATIKFEVK